MTTQLSPLTRAYITARHAHTFADGIRLPIPARVALKHARERLALDGMTPRTYDCTPEHWFARGPQHGAADESGLRWIEGAESIMRRVGFADEIAREEGLRSIDHYGWHTTDEGDTGETYVGVAYQVTGRNGAPRYVAGYEHCEGYGRKRSNMTDGARLDCSTLYDSKLDAARAGDRLAEIESERERDYQAGSEAGFMCAELIEEIGTLRRDALKLCVQVKLEARGANGERMSRDSAIADALARAVSRARMQMRQLRKETARIAEGARWRNPEAFDESAGEKIARII